MDFDELQKSWRSQPVDVPPDNPEMRSKVVSRWRRQQRGVMWHNVGITVIFMGVLSVLGWVYTSFHKGRTLFFSGSLLAMAILLVVYLWVLWYGLNYKKTDPSLSSVAYIEHYLQKLRWRRKTFTTFTWVYSILLWLVFMFYCVDVTNGGSWQFRVGAPLSITIYIFGMKFFTNKTTQKKKLNQIDELIADMERLKSNMD